ncbi:hypothetical protein CYMTET_37877 [Cymbomonas tetramitiformis]|uniref:HECT-type E3 ubiquitin transferase n=1 Tax=Cymbomonas tetramitiformis TaxID=36881 RepID=A0AAE0F610_9CHLO|nr:hypothetical protein CYMTET_37877 [Cymbomonas tetramitiformis]
MDSRELLHILSDFSQTGIARQVAALPILNEDLALTEDRHEALVRYDVRRYCSALAGIFALEAHPMPEARMLAARALVHFVRLEWDCARHCVRSEAAPQLVTALLGTLVKAELNDPRAEPEAAAEAAAEAGAGEAAPVTVDPVEEAASGEPLEGMEGEAGEAEAAEGVWACPVCTYHNVPNSSNCEMCGTASPLTAAAPAVAAAPPQMMAAQLEQEMIEEAVKLLESLACHQGEMLAGLLPASAVPDLLRFAARAAPPALPADIRRSAVMTAAYLCRHVRVTCVELRRLVDLEEVLCNLLSCGDANTVECTLKCLYLTVLAHRGKGSHHNGPMAVHMMEERRSIMVPRLGHHLSRAVAASRDVNMDDVLLEARAGASVRIRRIPMLSTSIGRRGLDSAMEGMLGVMRRSAQWRALSDDPEDDDEPKDDEGPQAGDDEDEEDEEDEEEEDEDDVAAVESQIQAALRNAARADGDETGDDEGEEDDDPEEPEDYQMREAVDPHQHAEAAADVEPQSASAGPEGGATSSSAQDRPGEGPASEASPNADTDTVGKCFRPALCAKLVELLHGEAGAGHAAGVHREAIRLVFTVCLECSEAVATLLGIGLLPAVAAGLRHGKQRGDAETGGGLRASVDALGSAHRWMWLIGRDDALPLAMLLVQVLQKGHSEAVKQGRGAEASVVRWQPSVDTSINRELLSALQANNTAGARAALDHGADVNCCDAVHQSALMWGVYKADADAVCMLVDRGANVDAANAEGTALMYAARLGKEEVVRRLLARGADPRLAGRAGRTPAEEARRQGFHAVARVIAEHEEAQAAAAAGPSGTSAAAEGSAEEAAVEPEAEVEVHCGQVQWLEAVAQLLPALLDSAREPECGALWQRSAMSLVEALLKGTSASALGEAAGGLAEELAGCVAGYAQEVLVSRGKDPGAARRVLSLLRVAVGRVPAILPHVQRQGVLSLVRRLRARASVPADAARASSSSSSSGLHKRSEAALLAREAEELYSQKLLPALEAAAAADSAEGSLGAVCRLDAAAATLRQATRGEATSTKAEAAQGEARSALEDVVRIVQQTHGSLSVHELMDSGVPAALLGFLLQGTGGGGSNIQLLGEVLGCSGGDRGVGGESVLPRLVAWLQEAVAVAVEGLEGPSMNDGGGSGLGGADGLDLLTRPLTLRVERAPGNSTLRQLQGCILKVEPLCPLRQLAEHLAPAVVLQWYERPRHQLEYILEACQEVLGEAAKDGRSEGEAAVGDAIADKASTAQEAGKAKGGVHLPSSGRPGEGEGGGTPGAMGVLEWIGTNGRRSRRVNPAKKRLVTVTTSMGVSAQCCGDPDSVVGGGGQEGGFHCMGLRGEKHPWVSIDLGVHVELTHYRLELSGEALGVEWILEGGQDGSSWHLLHRGPAATAQGPRSGGLWELGAAGAGGSGSGKRNRGKAAVAGAGEAVRHVRLRATKGRGLPLGWMELYGTVVWGVKEPLQRIAGPGRGVHERAAAGSSRLARARGRMERALGIQGLGLPLQRAHPSHGIELEDMDEEREEEMEVLLPARQRRRTGEAGEAAASGRMRGLAHREMNAGDMWRTLEEFDEELEAEALTEMTRGRRRVDGERGERLSARYSSAHRAEARGAGVSVRSALHAAAAASASAARHTRPPVELSNAAEAPARCGGLEVRGAHPAGPSMATVVPPRFAAEDGAGVGSERPRRTTRSSAAVAAAGKAKIDGGDSVAPGLASSTPAGAAASKGTLGPSQAPGAPAAGGAPEEEEDVEMVAWQARRQELTGRRCGRVEMDMDMEMHMEVERVASEHGGLFGPYDSDSDGEEGSDREEGLAARAMAEVMGGGSRGLLEYDWDGNSLCVTGGRHAARRMLQERISEEAAQEGGREGRSLLAALPLGLMGGQGLSAVQRAEMALASAASSTQELALQLDATSASSAAVDAEAAAAQPSGSSPEEAVPADSAAAPSGAAAETRQTECEASAAPVALQFCAGSRSSGHGSGRHLGLRYGGVGGGANAAAAEADATASPWWSVARDDRGPTVIGALYQAMLATTQSSGGCAPSAEAEQDLTEAQLPSLGSLWGMTHRVLYKPAEDAPSGGANRPGAAECGNTATGEAGAVRSAEEAGTADPELMEGAGAGEHQARLLQGVCERVQAAGEAVRGTRKQGLGGACFLPGPKGALGMEAAVTLQLLLLLRLAGDNARLSEKFRAVLRNPVTVAGGLLPAWCRDAALLFPELLPMSARELLFSCVAFGPARAVHSVLEGSAAASNPAQRSQRGLPVGSLRKHRMVIGRAPVLEWAAAVVRVHGAQRSMLEISFKGERGFGLGVTAEWYAMVACSLQSAEENAKLPMWHVGGSNGYGQQEEDAGDPGRSVVMAGGLFPAILKDGAEGDEVGAKLLERFRLLGAVVAKSLQDRHMLPLVLSKPFLKAVIGERLELEDIQDLATLDSSPAFLLRMSKLVASQDQDPAARQLLKEAIPMGCYFVVPTAQDIELYPDSGDVELTPDNAAQYVQQASGWMLDHGIKQQVAAFREGMRQVSAAAVMHLKMYTASELQRTVAGDLDVLWDPACATTADPEERFEQEVAALQRLLVPQHGYTRDSPELHLLSKALAHMNPEDRRRFLAFATGCPHLPPGGLAALQPPLTVMRRSDADTDLTTSSTCFRYLKMPAYSTLAILEERLKYSMSNSQGLIDMS